MEMWQKWVQAYFDLEDAFEGIHIRHHMPDGPAFIENPVDGKRYAMPNDETLEQFYDRIRRSKECGRNLFFEEWEPYTFEYDPEFIY